jgi:RHS repeat-associated protein
LLGQIADEDAEIGWTQFRCFDADCGRWLTPDPSGLIGGLNAFAFDGAPIVVVDPSGLSTNGGNHASAAAKLPQMKGMSVAESEKTLRDNGFVQTHVSNSAAKNQSWEHPDGSRVRIHPYGNVSTTMQNGQPTPKSGVNGHVHKVDPQNNDLNDRGIPSANKDETHIGIKNPPDLPNVRNRSHGSGA